jgi:hypothetical protein
MKTVATRLIIVCVLSNLGSVGAQAQSNQGAAVAMPRMFVVAAVAYRDLESRLKEWESKSTARGSTESEAQKYDSDIRNYTVELLEYSGKIYATFSLRPLRVESASSGNFQCRPMAGVSWINQAAPHKRSLKVGLTQYTANALLSMRGCGDHQASPYFALPVFSRSPKD